MVADQAISEFLRLLKRAIDKNNFVDLTLVNKRQDESDLKKVLASPVEIKDQLHLSFIYRQETKDITKNYTLDESPYIIEDLILNSFLQGSFNTKEYTYYLTIFKNGKSKLRHKKLEIQKAINIRHDKEKVRFIKAIDNEYLQFLGITSSEFKVKNKAQDKFKQINRYIEIIDDILKKTVLPENPKIVDMGSGKGYLTFALYDYFLNYRKTLPYITGVEMREDLVDKCNDIANKVQYSQLQFEKNMIQDFEREDIDFLIALHACDTATDDAIKKGIESGSKLIICAPCCQKQVRKRMKTDGVFRHITKHGILKERQAEILTDTIRAMILEAWGYKTRVFEFINTTHTPKNVLIVATLDQQTETPDSEMMEQVLELKEQFGITKHYLETIL